MTSPSGPCGPHGNEDRVPGEGTSLGPGQGEGGPRSQDWQGCLICQGSGELLASAGILQVQGQAAKHLQLPPTLSPVPGFMGPDQLPPGLISWAASWGQDSSVPARSWEKVSTQHLVQVRRGSAIPLTLSYPEGEGTGRPVRGSGREDMLHWELLPIILGVQLLSSSHTTPLTSSPLPFHLCLPGSGSPSAGLLRPRFIPASATCKLMHLSKCLPVSEPQLWHL